jgi:small-conductance mechanosensitive channel
VRRGIPVRSLGKPKLEEFRAGSDTFVLTNHERESGAAPVIWNALVKHQPVPVRSFALALLLLISATPLGWAAEPATATIVLQLQLPPSTSPEAVKGLIADLAAKGALPVTQPTEPPGAAIQPTITAANLAAQVWDGSKQAVQALPALGQAPQIWIEKVVAGGGGSGLAFGFWMVALAGLFAAAPIGMVFRALADRQTRVTERGPPAPWRTAIIWFLAAIASLAVFGLLFLGVLLWVSRGVPILKESADQLVWSALKWRLLITVLLIVMSKRADLRLLSIDDTDARVCFRWVAVYLAVIPLYPFLIWVIERLGFGHDAIFGVTLFLGLAITAYKIAMFWAIRYPIAHALLAGTGQEPGPIRRAVAASWHWFFIALAIGIYLTGTFEIFLGQSTSSVLSASSATTGIVVALAVLGQVSHNVIARRFLAEAADVRLTLRRERRRRALHCVSDALLCILGGVWLAETWGVDLVEPTPGSLAQLFARPVLEAAITVVAAWVLWTAIGAIIDEKMPRAVSPGEAGQAVPGSVSRLATLLPLLRHAVLIIIVVAGTIAALERLGFNIGPLLAGLGIFGVAIGFGAQTLVRDVISGVFFLLEDAFRVGEYIQSGNYKGTVESFSIRSVRLRHHRGPVYTVPFGLLGAIENQSRDWVIDKITVGVTYDSDLEKARKLIKQIGLDLQKDPEFAPLILQPLKMQGVENLGDYAVRIRAKMMTVPGEQFVIRRKAYAMIMKAFDENGIKFAFPTVQVAGEGEAATGAVAHRTLELTQPPAAA